MQVKKQRLEPDMEQRTCSKLGKEYIKNVYCYPAYLTFISGMRTLRHMGLGELLKHTLAAEPGSWIPGLPLSPQPGFSTVLTQSHPSCTHADVVGAGGRRARGGTAGPCGVVLSRRGPTARVGWGQPAFSDREEGGQLVLIWGGVHSQPLFQEGGPLWA